MSDPLMTTTPSTDHAPSPLGFAWYVLLALSIAFFIRFFIAAPYVVSGSSMEPTFDNWDYLVTDRLSYRLVEPKRGDVVVFCLPHAGECSLFDRLKKGTWFAPRTLIKRVIGLPGETITIEGNAVTIVSAAHPNGVTLQEPYLSSDNLGGPTGVTTSLGPDEYFVLGDNRRVSSDSRVWGVLPREHIVGRVIVRLFPITQIGLLPGTHSYREFSPAHAD